MSGFCGTERGWKAHKALNEPPCRFCVRAVTAPTPPPPPKPIPHGTDAGYWREKRAGTPPCVECLKAHSEYNASRRKKRPVKSGRPMGRPASAEAPCGTYAAAHRHERRGEPVDDACVQARRDYQREMKRKQRGVVLAARKEITHGTAAGRTAHIRRGETPCDDCREAYNKSARDNRAKRKLATND